MIRRMHYKVYVAFLDVCYEIKCWYSHLLQDYNDENTR